VQCTTLEGGRTSWCAADRGDDLVGVDRTQQPKEDEHTDGEQDGLDYHFLSSTEFERRVQAGEFVEHADYAGRRYGTLRSELEQRVAAGAPVVLEIEVQGARQVRAAMPEAVQVFIAPPSLEALRSRLIGRGTDDPEEVERRLRVAEGELAAQPEFGHVVVNDRLEDALEQLSAVVSSELE